MCREAMQQALKAHEAAKDIVDGVPQWHNAGYAAQLIDASITALRAALAEQPASTEASNALENCRLFAAQHRNNEWAKTILRFCSEGGVTGSPLRAEQPAPVLTDAERLEWVSENTGRDTWLDQFGRRFNKGDLQDLRDAIDAALAARPGGSNG